METITMRKDIVHAMATQLASIARGLEWAGERGFIETLDWEKYARQCRDIVTLAERHYQAALQTTDAETDALLHAKRIIPG